MAKTGLRGPYQLTFDGIASAVTRQSAGVYVLGHTTDEGKFRIQYIGRSDSDVRDTLRGYIGSNTSFMRSANIVLRICARCSSVDPVGGLSVTS